MTAPAIQVLPAVSAPAAPAAPAPSKPTPVTIQVDRTPGGGTPTNSGDPATPEAVEAALAAAKAAKAAKAPPAPADVPADAPTDGEDKAAKPEAVKPPTAADVNSINEEDIAAIEDPALRAAGKAFLSMAGKHGLDIHRIMGAALDRGDASLIDMAYLKDKAGDEAALLGDLCNDLVEGCKAYTEQCANAAITIAGGQAGWDAAVAAFNKTAPAATKNLVREALNSGDLSRIKDGAAQLVAFAQQSGLIKVQGERVEGKPAAGEAQGLSAAELREKLKSVNPRAPNYAAEINELTRLRTLGKAQGR